MKRPDNPEWTRFTAAMRKIVSVPKSEVMRRMEAERAARTGPKRGPKPKTSVSRASDGSPNRAV